MLGKLGNLWLHNKKLATGTRNLQYRGADKIDAFYSNVEEGLRTLEDSVGPNPPSFSLEGLNQAVNFIRSLHAKVHCLIEELWLPVRTNIGVDVLNLYLEVSKKLLDMCNYLTDGVLQLESYQMSLEHALASLASAIDSLSDHGENHDSKVLSSLQACKNELERIESKKRAPTLWADFVSKMGLCGAGCTGNQGGCNVKNREMSMQRSVSVLTTPSLDKKAFDISLVMIDAEAVTTFISCLLLWVLTDSSETFKCAFNFDKRQVTNGHVDWSASLFRLREKIQDSESKENTEMFRVNSLREFEDVRRSTHALHDKIEMGLKQERESGSVKESLEDSTIMLEKTKGNLAQIVRNSERLAMQISDTFSEIILNRKKLVDAVENHLTRSPTM